MVGMSISRQILESTQSLQKKLKPLKFADPVSYVYNPIEYAGASHRVYIERFANSEKKVLFMGMNPGPWGMAQTGVPFGEIPAVRDWMGIEEAVGKPDPEHPKRPIVGFACEKSEVSGRRLWGLFSEHYPNPDDFFADHYIVNYCPLVWMEEGGKNRTPDKLPAAEMEPVNAACDEYVGKHLQLLNPEWVIGVGAYAENCLKRIAEEMRLDLKIGRVLHPSPASPAANRGWAEAAAKQLGEIGIW